jgi:hypothetical protein
VDNAFSPSGNLWIAKLPWRTLVTSDFASGVAKTQRREPFVLDALRLFESETLRIALPAGWRIEGAPQTSTFSNPNGAFEISYRVSPGLLTASRTVRIFGDRVPTVSYQNFKEFLENVIRQQSMAVILKEGP